ncbi:hypothetical protein SUDANB146_00326 [Streptomyces sp. enrichment culture]
MSSAYVCSSLRQGNLPDRPSRTESPTWHRSPRDISLSETETGPAPEADIASRREDRVTVLHEIADEPDGVSWSRAEEDAERIVPVVRAADRIPVFVTGFGTRNHAGEGADDFAMSQRSLGLMAEKEIGWVSRDFSDDHRTGAVFTPGACAADGPWAGTAPLGPVGVWIRDRVRTPDAFRTE